MFIGYRPDGTIYGTWTVRQPIDADHQGMVEVPDKPRDASMDSVAIVGQSNAARLWELGISPAPTPAAGVSMWNLGSNTWTPPVNHLVTFCNSLKSQSGKNVKVLPCAIDGTFMGDWMDTSPTGALGKFLSAITASGSSLKACWFVHGESDANSGITVAQYMNGLDVLRSAVNTLVGASVPFMISPIGITEHSYGWGRLVFEAQLKAIMQKGFLRGPDYYDLNTSDGVHMTPSDLAVFAARGATVLAPILAAA